MPMNTPVALPEHFARVSEALDILAGTHQPTGLVDPMRRHTLTALSGFSMRPIDYMSITSFCGNEEPTATGLVDATNWKEPQLIERLAAQYGRTNPFGLTGWILARSLQITFEEQGWTDREGLVRYQNNRGRNCTMDTGLGSGCMTMGIMLGEVAAFSKEHGTDYECTASRSLASLPVPFAKMPNNDSIKVEVLYNIRTRGSYTAADAAMELRTGCPEQFRLAYQREKDQVAPTAWEASRPYPLPSNAQCEAVSHPVFGKTWRHLINATVALPELFPART